VRARRCFRALGSTRANREPLLTSHRSRNTTRVASGDFSGWGIDIDGASSYVPDSEYDNRRRGRRFNHAFLKARKIRRCSRDILFPSMSGTNAQEAQDFRRDCRQFQRGAKGRRELDQWDSRATEKLRLQAAKGLARTCLSLSISNLALLSINLRLSYSPYVLFSS